METGKETLQERYKKILPFLTEKQKRIYLGNEANICGYGGISEVSRITGVSRRAISEGIKELNKPEDFSFDKVRKEGAGRIKTIEKDKTIIDDLARLLSSIIFA